MLNCSGPPHPRLIPGNDNEDDIDDDDGDDGDYGDYVDGVVCGYEISIHFLFCACANYWGNIHKSPLRWFAHSDSFVGLRG